MTQLEQFRRQKDEFMRSPESPLDPKDRATFSGLKYFPENPGLAFDLDLETDVPHDLIAMETSTGGKRNYQRVGKVDFQVDGQAAVLSVYEDENGYFLPWRDATGGSESYPAGRYLEPEMVNGKLNVDFNYAYNPYCAYSPRFSCPLPPVENWLKVPIRAGEMVYPRTSPASGGTDAGFRVPKAARTETPSVSSGSASPSMRRRTAVFGLVLVGAVGLVWAYAHRVAIRERVFTRKSSVPVAVNRTEIAAATDGRLDESANGAAADRPLPAAVNLKVPFTSQAPDANWDQDHEEFCEEAAALMVGRYWQDRAIEGKSEAETALQEIKSFELKELGFYFDTTAAETAQILEKLYGLRVEVVADPSLDDIKRAVASGNPVIVPTTGRELGNPNFRRPGPVYHNLVVKGYTADGKLITNDPGTRKGADYVYDANVVMSAMHDWVPSGDRTKPGNGSATGEKVVIIARGA